MSSEAVLDRTLLTASEPMILVEEITHRVANEYTQVIASLALAAARVADAEARRTLTGAARRLRAFAEAHRALRLPTEGVIDAGEYLQGVCASLSNTSLAERGVRLTLTCDGFDLAAGQAWRLGLIVAELVSNAARHGLKGKAGAIVVEVAARRGDVWCRVRDNGSASDSPPPGRGRRVVEGLAADLQGRVLWNFGAAGTTVAVGFPIAAPAA